MAVESQYSKDICEKVVNSSNRDFRIIDSHINHGIATGSPG